jgi:polyisoprenoid-binding protein YceI
MLASVRSVLFLLAVVAGLLAGCAPGAPTQGAARSPSVPAGLPETFYRQAEANGVKVLRVDPVHSLLAIEVRRAGSLARLGHDHVVASHDVQGYVAPEQGRADLVIPLARLTVDETPLRAQAGFDTQPSTEAIEGTRRNMLEKVLEVERFPLALIRIDRTADPAHLRVIITLHGVTREYQVPAQIEAVAGGLVVSGRLDFKQSDFGIIPFSILGGAVQVQDRLDLRFRIQAGG